MYMVVNIFCFHFCIDFLFLLFYFLIYFTCIIVKCLCPCLVRHTGGHDALKCVQCFLLFIPITTDCCTVSDVSERQGVSTGGGLKR